MLGTFLLFNEPLLAGAIIIAAAILLDLVIGDPRWLPHPVVLIGKFISYIEQRGNHGSHRRRNGIILAVSVSILVLFITCTLVVTAYYIHPLAGAAVEIHLISTTIAIKGLRAAALNVYVPLVQGDVVEARQQVSMIIGRDTDHLPEDEIARGAVETVAENTVDGITAPLFWALVGGAPLAMVYRAVNTLDSMVGYKNETYGQYGWASAKTDDVINWLPARLTAFTMWLASFFIKGSNRNQAWKITVRDAQKHPSPNSGWPEAMTAGLLGIQLGGVNYYDGEKSVRAVLGDPCKKTVPADIKRAIFYMHGGWIVFLLIGSALLLMFN
ncbi:adenosylcobinamide-phosphate synthase CbiB [Salsuginibacillus kocurii]|uniref:adenosylcobinamide-phosphate synthase CbiB n=1 Tax=Salsuginibacillus kocurii TaxID=427078 RepID=UPI0003698BA7|nr:adenosylcobinamide-phosphate synthase CbiB [Salsuginibacillus kocurii]